mgnify:CR=1 FL=1
MNKKKEEKSMKDIFDDFLKDHPEIKFEKTIGEGGFGLVNEVKYKNKSYAAKLVKREKKYNESDLVYEFKSLNIVKIVKIYDKKYEDINESYNLIIMEKANLRDAKQFQSTFFNNIKLIIKPPFEGIVGDNFIRFFAKQIIQGLESLNRSEYSHFDIKPDNILIFLGMLLKLTDFSLLRNPNEIKRYDDRVEIPGGTAGYLSPEYYLHSKVSIDVAKKQDYFALGSTLYYLKYKKNMLPYKEYKENLMNYDILVDLLQRAIDFIRSQELSDKDFIDFLISLIQYDPKERPIFEEIYRNKWLNKYSEDISQIYYANQHDDEKLIFELNKNDYLKHKKRGKKNIKKFVFKI